MLSRKGLIVLCVLAMGAIGGGAMYNFKVDVNVDDPNLASIVEEIEEELAPDPFVEEVLKVEQEAIDLVEAVQVQSDTKESLDTLKK
jgi:hypothetical protein